MTNKPSDIISQIHQLASQNSTEEWLPKAADLIRDAFDFYFVGFYFIDESKQKAVFQAGSGEIGNVLKKNSYTLPLFPKLHHPHILPNEICLYDWHEEKRHHCLLTDVIPLDFTISFTDASHTLHSPLLPQIRWQLFLPLQREQFFGALEIQNEADEVFTSENIQVLLTLAHQLASLLKL